MDKEFFTNHLIELEKQKISCGCGGKYKNHEKDKHLNTKIHKKFIIKQRLLQEKEEKRIEWLRIDEEHKERYRLIVEQDEQDKINNPPKIINPTKQKDDYDASDRYNLGGRYGMGGWMDRT